MLNKFILIIALILGGLCSSFGVVLSPQPRCVSVLQPNGIKITWDTPADPLAEFVSYDIYKSSALGGPYTFVVSVNVYLQTSYSDFTSNGNTAPVYYYIQTTYNSGGIAVSPPLDTVESIYLNLINPANGTIVLNWNAISSPLFSSSTGVYNIYMEFPIGAGNWALTGSTTNLNFLDTLFVCNSTVRYRVEISDSTGCTSISSTDTPAVAVTNQIVPTTPTLDTLSVNNGNTALMNWNANSAPDVAGYIVYRWNGSGWILVDTVFGINSTTFNNLSSTAGSGSEQYQVAAFDICGNISPMSPPLATIYLTGIGDICGHSITLNWTPYPTIGAGLMGYKIYESSAGVGGPYGLIGNVAAGVLTFTAGGLTTGTTYFYKIKAYDVSGAEHASSNRMSYYCPAPIPPNFLYLVSANVSSNNRIDITGYVDTAASVLGYKILRSESGLPTTFAQVGVVSPPGYPLIMFSDYSVEADKRSYYYQIINVDSCGYDGLSSNIGRTIHVTAVGNSDFTNTITFNKYEYWGGRVTAYNIYRGLDGILNPIPLVVTDSVYANDTSIIDNVWDELKGDGNFYYQVEAVEGAGNIFGFGSFSNSNIAIAKQDLQIFVPNAFAPEGVNKIFLPVGRWEDYYNYELTIFNRWGEEMFSTNKITKGWDGNYAGSKCESGAYVYILKYSSAKGDDFVKKGTVTLIR